MNSKYDFALFLHEGTNMTNCYKQCQLFFERYESINLKVLIGYWMKAGYLGPVYSAEEAYRKGEGILLELIDQQGMLKYSDEDKEMIEFVMPADSVPISCRHLGLCATKSLDFLDVLDLGEVGEVEVRDGMSQKKKKKAGSIDKEVRYVANSNPRPNSLKPLLKNVKKPTALLLRGCELAFRDDFPFEKFRTLTVLEISRLTHMPSSLETAISNLTLLEYLKLSQLPIETLGIDFSGLRNLRHLFLRGSFDLAADSVESFCHLTLLQRLDFVDLVIETLPENFFSHLVELHSVKLKYCFNLLSLPNIESLKKLEELHLTFCSALKEFKSTSLPTHLQMLDLCGTEIPDLPALREIPNLTHLLLRNATGSVYDSLINHSGVWSVKQAEQFGGSHGLVALDLSTTGIRTLEFLLDLIHLRKLVCRKCHQLQQVSKMENLKMLELLDFTGCRNLCGLPQDIGNLRNLKKLDLSGCNSISELSEGIFDHMSCLEILSLSETGIVQLPSFANLVSLRDLSLGGLELCSLKSLASLSSLVELDLQGVKARFSQNLQLDFLESLVNLQLLNLSETFVEKLPDISQLVNLKQLLLARCRQLKLVSDLQTLTNLETLDLSLPQDYTMSNSQQETDSEAQSFQFLSPPSNLRKLVLAYRPGVLNLFPLASLGKLEYLDIRGTDEIDLVRAHSSKMENLEEVVGWDSHTYQRQPEERSIKADEVHVISIFYQSGFDRFITEFTELEKLISHIQEEIKSASPDMIAKANIENQAFKRHFGSLLFDLKYLQKHINLLKTSNNSKTSEELLHELMDVATHPSAYDFSLDSTNLNLLIRLIVKLKLLFPTKLVDDLEALETTQEKKLQFTRTKCKKMVAVDNVKDPQRITDLLGSFESLTDIEKNCLLCFSIFPGSKGKNENTQFLKSGRLVIKKRMLIHWWIGEGFIHPQHDKNAEEDSAIEMLKNSRTTEEIGREILKSLEKKGFVKTVSYKGRDSGSCSMQPFVHSFMVARATEKGFFDFGQGNGELTPNFTRSRRVCLLKTEDDFPTSWRLGRSHKSASKRLQSFNTIRALLNVNESIIDIRAEWFSNLKDLFVLHLGGWGCQEGDHIEVMDQKFLEDLKCMKQLRLLSLQGFSAIKKLPDSVCKLTNLRVLNLRDCSYLEELPADIGYLKNLIHLDLTHCRILSKLPKGVRLLSKIEVLKGFVISYQGSSEHGKACLLQDLLKLEMLNKLSILVNIDKFPSTEDVMVFKEMKNLCNLKITWEKSYSEYEEPQHVAVSQKALRHSRWQKLKCWEQQTRQNDTEESSGGNHLDKLKKLVLCCFPLETIPDWFIPSNFKNLEKLYIVGGSLTSMPGTDENTWNVQVLRFKYLRNLKMTFEVLEIKFPSMRYLEIYQCDKLPFLPLDEGVWTKPDTNGPSSE